MHGFIIQRFSAVLHDSGYSSSPRYAPLSAFTLHLSPSLHSFTCHSPFFTQLPSTLRLYFVLPLLRSLLFLSFPPDIIVLYRRREVFLPMICTHSSFIFHPSLLIHHSSFIHPSPFTLHPSSSVSLSFFTIPFTLLRNIWITFTLISHCPSFTSHPSSF